MGAAGGARQSRAELPTAPTPTSGSTAAAAAAAAAAARRSLSDNMAHTAATAALTAARAGHAGAAGGAARKTGSGPGPEEVKMGCSRRQGCTSRGRGASVDVRPMHVTVFGFTSRLLGQSGSIERAVAGDVRLGDTAAAAAAAATLRLSRFRLLRFFVLFLQKRLLPQLLCKPGLRAAKIVAVEITDRFRSGIWSVCLASSNVMQPVQVRTKFASFVLGVKGSIESPPPFITSIMNPFFNQFHYLGVGSECSLFFSQAHFLI